MCCVCVSLVLRSLGERQVYVYSSALAQEEGADLVRKNSTRAQDSTVLPLGPAGAHEEVKVTGQEQLLL